ncbi:hypothetical protein [Spiroplasma endosymbiont of Clivina fossor]|uniref:hypothetical protein n=1 Tax=Spiroplasma endosymbiont of Clivina fossor TaxID=3066282 RepID=UPI00313EE0B0
MKKLLNVLSTITLTIELSSIVACENSAQKQIAINKPVINKPRQPPKNVQRSKRNINFEKELEIYKKYQKPIINFNKVENNIISFFKDNYNENYFITNNGLYVLKQKNNEIIKINNINNSNIWFVNFDSENNMYFGVYSTSFGSSGGEVYFLKNGETTAIKINGINERIFNTSIDNKNNVYFDSDNGLYVLKKGETTATLNKKLQKYGFYKKTLGFNDKNDLYFTTSNSTYVLKNNEIEPNKIDELNGEVNSIVINKNKIYFATNNGAYILKQGQTKPIKINEISFLNKDNKINYFLFDNNKIYIGSLFNTYILDFNYKIIKTLYFDSHCFNYDNKGNIYFGSGRGIYKFDIYTKDYQKIKINKNNNLYYSDDEIMDIYVNNNNDVYFKEYTRKSINFYKIKINNIAEKVEKFSKIWI